MAKKMSRLDVVNRLKKCNPKISIDLDTYVNMRTKCRFIDEDFGDFWASPRLVVNGKQRHPKFGPEKRSQTMLERFGVKSIFQSEKIKNKIKKTMQAKYGVDSPLKNPDSLSKFKKTMKSRFGTENPMESPELVTRQRQAMLTKYGVEHVMQISEICSKALQKTKATNRARYGVDSTLSLPSVRAKIKKTMLAKYGFESPLQSPEIKEKIRQTWIENGYASKPEQEVRDFIESFGIKTEKKYLGGNPGVEVDIVCPDQRVAFEYNGDYWHSEANESVHRNYHLTKTQRCLENGLQLMHIFGSEWTSKQEIVKDIIRSKLGALDRKLMARKLEIREVSFQQTKDFFNENHLQGAPRFWKTWGLFEGDELVAAAAFSKPHRQNMDPEPHLSRFACKLGVGVSGGLSRLCSHAFKQIGPFVSFVHLRLSNGNSYLKAGFTEVKILPPDYWYWDVKNHIAISKQARKKSVVKTPKGMTEKEHATLDGLYRIWDCGKKKYRYSRN